MGNCKQSSVLDVGVKTSNGLIMFGTFNLQLCLVCANWSGTGIEKNSKSRMASPHMPLAAATPT